MKLTPNITLSNGRVIGSRFMNDNNGAQVLFDVADPERVASLNETEHAEVMAAIHEFRNPIMFLVEGVTKYTKLEMLTANADDDEVTDWLKAAQVGDRWCGFTTVECVANITRTRSCDNCGTSKTNALGRTKRHRRSIWLGHLRLNATTTRRLYEPSRQDTFRNNRSGLCLFRCQRFSFKNNGREINPYAAIPSNACWTDFLILRRHTMNNYDDACEDLTQMFWNAMNAGHLMFATELLDTLTEWESR